MIHYSDIPFSIRGIAEPAVLQETALVKSFLSIPPGTVLTGVKNEEIVIIAPGKENRFDGPDITDATLFINGQYLHGEIECHLSEMDWLLHGHSNNERYLNIILHVLMFHDSDETMLGLPTVVLPGHFLHGSTGVDGSCPVKFSQSPLKELEKISEKKWNQFVNRFFRYSWDKTVLYQRLLFWSFRVSGSRGNADTMGSLAMDIITGYPELDNDGLIKRDLYHLADQYIWSSKNVRPFKRRERILVLAEKLIRLTVNLKEHDGSFPGSVETYLQRKLSGSCGSGTRNELLGNVFYPFAFSMALLNREFKKTRGYLQAWKKLKLPYTYGYLDRRFRPNFTTKDLKSFHILQGLREVNDYFCTRDLCSICPLQFKGRKS